MKTLFLTLRSPYPPQRGDKIRAFNFIRYLVDRGYEVDLICFAEREEDTDYIVPLRGYCRKVRMVRFSRPKALLRAALRLPTRTPLQNGYWFSRKLARQVKSMISSERYDLIHAQLFRMGQYVKGYRMPKVLDLTDSLAMNLRRRMRIDRSLLLPLIALEQRRVRRFEVDIAGRFDVALVASEIDRFYLLRRNPRLKIRVIPTAVDIDFFKPTGRSKEPVLLFTGTMGYFPNDDAVLFFHREVLPLVKREIPEVKFYVVGNDPPPKVRSLESNGDTIVTGHVEDVRPYFEMASLFVCPLRSGSGIQTKNLEAMAMGVPVVTTSFGFEGIEAIPGRDLIVADTPEDIASQVIRLLRDPDLRERIGRNGRKVVEERYSWRVVGRKLVEVYEEVMEGWQSG
ncbi:TPA: glycosyltransferase [Candidatus Poribacteria bacterium]|nr:glycosyltransferase [Candidatus Poribacteria bacterium]